MNRRLADVTVGQLVLLLAVAAIIVGLVFGLRDNRRWERRNDPARITTLAR